MTEQELTDAIIRHALELQRLSAFEGARAEAILRELESELRTLLSRRALSEASKREIEALIKDAHNAISGKYTNIAGILDVEAVATLVADRTVEAMQGMFPSAQAPTIETIRSLTRDILIEGSPASRWWSRQAEDTAFKFAGIVRRGVINGETNEQIVRKVVGGRGETGLMEVSRRNARTLVHSSIMTAANQARLETFRKSGFAGVRWLATLDSHVCKICAALDGSGWDFDGKPLGQTKLDFQTPPQHFSCRCILTGIASFSGIEAAFPGMGKEFASLLGTRATAQGPQKVTMTQWLKRNPEAAEEVLGRKRVDLFLAGKLSLTDLVTKSGRPRSLEEIRR